MHRPIALRTLPVLLLIAACSGTQTPAQTEATPSATAVATATAEATEPITPVATTEPPATTEPTAESSATAEPTAEPAADALTVSTAAGTREDPVPPGEAARVGDYLVQVDSLIADATAEVEAEYHENEPPPEGHVYPLIGITIAFVGEGAGQFTFDNTFILEGPPGNDVLYTRNQSCGTIPGDVVYLGQFFPDSPLGHGNLCRAVPPEELPTLLVHLFPNLPAGDPGAYFSLPAAA